MRPGALAVIVTACAPSASASSTKGNVNGADEFPAGIVAVVVPASLASDVLIVIVVGEACGGEMITELSRLPADSTTFGSKTTPR